MRSTDEHRRIRAELADMIERLDERAAWHAEILDDIDCNDAYLSDVAAWESGHTTFVHWYIDLDWPANTERAAIDTYGTPEHEAWLIEMERYDA